MNSCQTEHLLWDLQEGKSCQALLTAGFATERKAGNSGTEVTSKKQFVLCLSALAGIFGLAMYLVWRYLL